MSGGRYHYGYHQLNDLADSIERDFLDDGKYEREYVGPGEDPAGDRIGDATPEQRELILHEIRSLLDDLRACSTRARELEWYQSGDTGATSYLRRLEDAGLLKKPGNDA